VGFLSLISSLLPYKLIYKLSTSFRSPPVSPTLLWNISDQLHLDLCSELLSNTGFYWVLYTFPLLLLLLGAPQTHFYSHPAFLQKVFSVPSFGALGFAWIYFGLLWTLIFFCLADLNTRYVTCLRAKKKGERGGRYRNGETELDMELITWYKLKINSYYCWLVISWNIINK
jgi:hypothetical protein